MKSKPIQIFNSLPLGHGRKEGNDGLDRVRRFRNKIKHNEPICFNSNTIEFEETLEVHKSIINLLTWIDPYIVKLVADSDKIHTRKRKIFNTGSPSIKLLVAFHTIVMQFQNQ
ncbi:hypothetical protein CHX27_13515 [Flavobacterium aurantiibacter]|uniref:CAAX protease n=1 Tax=Flavobacterium aurantiibacter TaxID=2023067 RepID=A0A255ZIZ0_9FLAO|nr:hypothetical protein CHX27_13515 [Flavobacterium aurantiibacter]